MTDSTSQPEPVDPGHDPGVDPPADDDTPDGADDRGPVDQSEREDRPGVTKDPDDPMDTDFHVPPGPME
jgi:hypothetical protein